MGKGRDENTYSCIIHLFSRNITAIRCSFTCTSTVFIICCDTRLLLLGFGGRLVISWWCRLVSLKQCVKQHDTFVLVETVEIRIAVRRPFWPCHKHNIYNTRYLEQYKIAYWKLSGRHPVNEHICLPIQADTDKKYRYIQRNTVFGIIKHIVTGSANY